MAAHDDVEKVARAIYEAGIPKGGKYYHQWEDLESEGFYAQHDLAMKQAHAAIGVCRAAFLPPPEARPVATDDQIERVARAICEATSGPFEMLDDVGRDALRWEARAAIAAMPELAALVAERDALREALEEIAKQVPAKDMDEDYYDAADFEDGYDRCIFCARAALASLKGGA
jgi:hypothetical protein